MDCGGGRCNRWLGLWRGRGFGWPCYRSLRRSRRKSWGHLGGATGWRDLRWEGGHLGWWRWGVNTAEAIFFEDLIEQLEFLLNGQFATTRGCPARGLNARVTRALNRHGLNLLPSLSKSQNVAACQPKSVPLWVMFCRRGKKQTGY